MRLGGCGEVLAQQLVSGSGYVPAGAGTPRVRPPVGGIFDSRSDALAGHWLVIEARDDMQVRVEPALIVPAERVAVGSEPLVRFGLYEKQKFPCRRPLLGGQVEPFYSPAGTEQVN